MENQKLKKIGDRCFPCPGDALLVGHTNKGAIEVSCGKIKNAYGLGVPLNVIPLELLSKCSLPKSKEARALVRWNCPYVEK